MLIPKKFLCYYKLQVGAYVTGIIMCCVMLASGIASVVQLLMVEDCAECGRYPYKISYGYSVTGCVYNFTMLAVNVWFLWGVKREKPSIVVSWVVVTAIWLVRSNVLLAVLLAMFRTEVNLAVWSLCFVLYLIGLGILLYGLLLGYAYWVELKTVKRVH